MKRINISLTTKGSIDKAIKELNEYVKTLNWQLGEFVRRLMDVGIETAQSNSGQYKGYIRFEKQVAVDSDGVEGLLIATDGKRLIREWYTSKKGGERRSYEVSALLLSEFGSGWLATVLDNVPGVGQGTMPNSYGHAADDDGWYWYDEDGIKHHSIGEAPTFPMHTALLAMEFEVDRIAKEVFGGK